MIKSILRSFIGIIKNNIDNIDKWSPIVFNILMSFNLIAILFSIWNTNLYESVDPTGFLVILSMQIYTSLIIVISIFYNLKRKNEQSKLNFNVFLIVSFIVIFSIPITYVILKVGRILSLNVDTKIGSPDGWLGFIGSIIGGIITMIAVVYTIQHERLLDSKKTLPYFNIVLDENNTIQGDVIDLSNIESFGVVPFRITNSSNFNAIDFKITHISFTRIGIMDNFPVIKDIYKEIIDEEFYGNIFYSKETRILYLPISENLAGPIYYNLLFEFEYFDFLKVKKYKVLSVNLVEVILKDIRRDELEMFIGKEVTFSIKQDSSTYRYLNL